MANSGSFSGSVCDGHYQVRVDWSAAQSAANNTSTISATIYLIIDSGWSLDISQRSNWIKINGTTYNFTTSAINKGGGTYTLATITSNAIKHNDDGTKTISMSFNFAMNATITGKGYFGSITGSKNVTLNTIARASTITSAANVTLGNNCSVKWTPNSSSFRYKLKFVLGSYSSTTGYISPSTTSAYTYTEKQIPLSVAEQITNAKTGTMTVYLYTYNGSTQIGTSSSKSFTITIPENSSTKPTVSSVSTSLINSNAKLAEWNVAVAGYTKIRVVANANAKYNGKISSFKITGGYSATVNGTSLDYTGSKITTAGSKTFTVVAKDSRGYSSASVESSSIQFYAYSKPSISKFTVSRKTSETTKVIVKANWSYSKVNNKNSATAKLYYKRSTASSWTSYGDISSFQNTSLTLSNTFEDTYSYDFKVEITDAVGNTTKSETKITTAAVFLDFRAEGKGLGIGKIAETDSVEIALSPNAITSVKIVGNSGKTISFDNNMFWKTLTLKSGVTACGYGGSSVPRYRKIGDRVDIVGAVNVTWNGNDNVWVATMPTGYIPANSYFWLATMQGDTNIARIHITGSSHTTPGRLEIRCLESYTSDTTITDAERWVELNTSYYILDSGNIES